MPSSFSKAAGMKAMKVTGRVDRGVGDPGVEGHGPGLADGPDHHQDEGRGGQSPSGWTEIWEIVSVPVLAQRMPMPRIMQKSQKPLMMKALTAVRWASLPPMVIRP